MTQTFNVIGPQDKIAAVLKQLKEVSGAEPGTLTFEKTASTVDLNISVEDKHVDAFTDICEALGLNPDLV